MIRITSIVERQMPPEGGIFESVTFKRNLTRKTHILNQISNFTSYFSQNSRFRDGNPNGNDIAWGMSGARLKKAIVCTIKRDQPPIRCTCEARNKRGTRYIRDLSITGRRGAVMSKDKETLL